MQRIALLLLTYCFLLTSDLCIAQEVSAKDILGNPKYPAMCFGGYRGKTRDEVPTVAELKEDLRILHAMGIRIVRTYNTQQYAHAANVLEAIKQLRDEVAGFEMYVMLGAWIDCEGAWSDKVNHESEDAINNRKEIDAAVALAKKYPKSIKIIAVGNESMVHWAGTYFVRPTVILKWVKHLQEMKKSGQLPKNLWITSSDNFASWGGGDESYHRDDLTQLLKAVDYISLHTYPFHDSHYNSDYWLAPAEDTDLTVVQRADAAMKRAADYAKKQYESAARYIRGLGVDKPIHIGETGWATTSNSLYGPKGSQAADEYKAKLYFDAMRAWTTKAGISCFYFEAFDEVWKDADNPEGSENHFGLITVDGQAKYALWDQVDRGVFKGLSRGGRPIGKTFDGDKKRLLDSILEVPVQSLDGGSITGISESRKLGDQVVEPTYIVFHKSLEPKQGSAAYPTAAVKLNIWEGTCGAEIVEDFVRISPGSGAWWGCALEIQGDGVGENLSRFQSGELRFEIRGQTKSEFEIGFQTGMYSKGNQTNNGVSFGSPSGKQLAKEWTSYRIPIKQIGGKANLKDVTSLLYLRGQKAADAGEIEVRGVYYSAK